MSKHGAVATLDQVKSTNGKKHWKVTALMTSMGKCACLLPWLNSRCCYIISLFVDHKCDLCGAAESIGLKDSQFTWQWWCLTCAISLLEDGTHINIHAGRCSLVANNSDTLEDVCWSTPTYREYEAENNSEEDLDSDHDVPLAYEAMN